ncbi:gamma-glutamyltransferase, partial [Leucobacter sp. M11]|uniref:gamma-glutamyltransferase n=1 Tax=Leucobacter sp. M11 TaxID=2993565 RepID=UPI002D80F0E1
ELTEPIEAPFGPYRVLTSPPNTQGFSLLRTLLALERTPLRDPLGADAAALAALFAGNNAVRDTYLADPRSGGASAEALLDLPVPGPARLDAAPRATGDTVGVSAISADGWAVSLIQSIYHGFGAAILEPDTGVLFHNRGTSFSLDPAAANVFAPGKRPRHTLMPVLVLRGSEVAWVSSTMGGQGQPQVHAQLLLRSWAGASPAEATSAPRFCVDVQRSGAPVPTIVFEEDLPEDARRALLSTGLLPVPLPPHSEKLGHANLIRVEPDGSFSAASDPRSDGSAAIVL